MAERILTIGPIADGSMSVDAVGTFLRNETARWISVTKEIGVLPESSAAAARVVTALFIVYRIVDAWPPVQDELSGARPAG